MVLSLAACGEKTEDQKDEPAAAEQTSAQTNETESAEPTEPRQLNTEEEQNNEEGQQADTEKEESNQTPTPNSTETPEDKVASYVKNNGASLTARLESELSSNGITSTCSVVASGTRIVFSCNLTDYDNLSSTDKAKIKIATIGLQPTASAELVKITEAEPEVTGADFKICEKDGDLITTISVNK